MLSCYLVKYYRAAQASEKADASILKQSINYSAKRKKQKHEHALKGLVWLNKRFSDLPSLWAIKKFSSFLN